MDKYSGEEYPGVASNYLRDLAPGDRITMSGPYGLAFKLPEEMDANLILIGTGTRFYGALAERGAELWKLLEQPNTYVYVAGLEKMRGELDEAFKEIAGSPQKWARRKAELVAGGRWVELLY